MQRVPSSARLCSNPFLKVNDRIKSKNQSSYVNDLRTYKRRTSIVAAESKKQGWDFGRFVKTLYFFNGPPSPFKVRSYYCCPHRKRYYGVLVFYIEWIDVMLIPKSSKQKRVKLFKSLCHQIVQMLLNYHI